MSVGEGKHNSLRMFEWNERERESLEHRAKGHLNMEYDFALSLLRIDDVKIYFNMMSY